jgi:hypothetical protein
MDHTPQDRLPTEDDRDPTAAEVLASGLVDGTLGAGATLEAAGSPEVLELADRFRAVSAAIGAPVSVPPSARESAISAALAAFDDPLPAAVDAPSPLPSPGSAPVAPGTPAPPPVPLAPRRRSGRSRWSGTLAGVGAAAAALVVIAGAGQLLSSMSGNDEDSASTAGDALTMEAAGTETTAASGFASGGVVSDGAERASGATEAALAGDATAASGGDGVAGEGRKVEDVPLTTAATSADAATVASAPAPTDVVDLGVVDTAEALAGAAGAVAPPPDAVADPAAAARCPAPDGAMIDRVATVVWQGVPAEVLFTRAVPVPDGSSPTTAPDAFVLVVLDADCVVLATVPMG